MSKLNPRQQFLRLVGQKALHDPRAGATYVASRLGVSTRRVRWQAVQDRPWPAIWFKALMQIGVEHGAQISLNDFLMREIDCGGEASTRSSKNPPASLGRTSTRESRKRKCG